MSDPTSQGSLHLEVRDFGPIVKAEIELRPLTVFVGPSNTGKTYLATLIYALHQHFSGRSQTPDFPSVFKAGGVRGAPKRTNTWPQQDINSLVAWAAQLSTKRKRNASNEGAVDLIDLDDSISNIIRLGFKARCDNARDLLRNEIIRCFGIDEIKRLVRRRSKIGARVVLRKHFSNDAPLSKHEMIIKNQKIEYAITTLNGTPVQIDSDRARELAYRVHDIAKTIVGQNEQTRGSYIRCWHRI